jgi:hypothetical protein
LSNLVIDTGIFADFENLLVKTRNLTKPPYGRYAGIGENISVPGENHTPNSRKEFGVCTSRQPPFVRRESSVSKTCNKQVVKAWQCDRQERQAFLVVSPPESFNISLCAEPQSITCVSHEMLKEDHLAFQLCPLSKG